MKYHLTFFVIFCFFSISFSQQTKCECYSKSGVKDKTGIGGWTSIIGTNSEGKQLQYHFYAAYFPPQELCIPRDNYWWQEVNAAILKAVKSHPIYKSSQIALQTDDPDATPKATNIAGQAFITQQKVNEIKSLPGTVVSVDAYIQDRFASKLQLCSDIGDERNIDKKSESNSKNKTLDKTSNSKSKNTNSSGAKGFIDSQNEQFLKQQELNQKLAEDLTQTFNKISDSWAKERDFQSKISSLTNIKSVNASSIISEARSKAQQINKAYAIRKQDALNQGVAATQNLVNSAQNEKQAIAGGILGAGLTALSQSSIEKERKKAQEKLENEKQQELKKLSQEIIDKFEPIKNQHEQAAMYAVKKDNEDYHLAQYEYAKCMIDNAYKIIVDDYACEKAKISKPVSKSKKGLSGKDYFDAYKRKKISKRPELNQKAVYFLELAIDAEPNNEDWIMERIEIELRDFFNITNPFETDIIIEVSRNEKTLPIGIGYMTNLKKLSVTHSQLTSIPESVGNLTKLIHLSLYDNKLTSFPKSILTLSNLEYLLLYHNYMPNLPEDIDKLKKLKQLHLAALSISTLPESIGNLSELEILNLEWNKLANLPKNLNGLNKLKSIYLNGNRFKIIPQNIQEITNLEILKLRDNLLGETEESLESIKYIYNLKKLKILDISKNSISVLPLGIENMSSLIELNISNNLISHLPEDLGNLQNLTVLNIENTYIKTFPESLQNLVSLRKLIVSESKKKSLKDDIKLIKKSNKQLKIEYR
ncbi:leucine-rich repeat domain-containing protein [Aurantibacter aestuarii]|uniref:Disease resistance R13L4/SHOC-2-like LRR domain-containing protein n=1 Tax=Aurantibacter aestuarii TaxID=1266046 RepID=A0A2T1N9G3_9FLAO|nr:hypothetical protein [Aurantibacter aestuarii]PSG88516.1 hypothetical protein C7H52_09465 [Aurantibacter aestuarii]